MSASGNEIRLAKSEIAQLSNILNEVLGGFAVSDWDRRIRGSRAAAVELLEQLNSAFSSSLDAGYGVVMLSPSQVGLLESSYLVCDAEFDDSEFGTRIGAPKQRVEQIIRAHQ